MQNKPYFFFGNRGSQKGGGSDTWEIFPKNPVFWGGGRPLSSPACCQEKNVLCCTFWCVYTTVDLSQDDVLANIYFLLLDFVLSPVSLLNHNRKFRWKLINPLAPHFHFVNNNKQQFHKAMTTQIYKKKTIACSCPFYCVFALPGALPS